MLCSVLTRLTIHHNVVLGELEPNSLLLLRKVLCVESRLIPNPNLPKQHKSCHLQIDPVFSNQRFATASRTDSLPLLRCRQCYQSTEHTCPPTYPKHARIGSCTKKLEQIFDFTFFWQDTVSRRVPD